MGTLLNMVLPRIIVLAAFTPSVRKVKFLLEECFITKTLLYDAKCDVYKSSAFKVVATASFTQALLKKKAFRYQKDEGKNNSFYIPYSMCEAYSLMGSIFPCNHVVSLHPTQCPCKSKSLVKARLSIHFH